MSKRCAGDRGYAMAALLVGMSVMAILMSMALPVWSTAAKREREAELIFRGGQYAHAIELFSRRTGGFPPSLDVLEKGRFIRKLYKDPMTGEGDFQPVYLGQVIAGQPVVPGQAGRGGQRGGQGGAQGGALGGALGGAQSGGPAGAPAGRTGQAPGTGGRGAPAAAQLPGVPGRSGTIGAGPIIGVVSKSTAESLRLYNGRGRYNEWAFVAVAATTQAGAPGGGQTPGAGRGGRGAEPGVPGRGGRGAEQGVPGRGGPGRFGPRRGEPPPGRGLPGRGDPAAGRGNPFGFPGGFPSPGGQQPGRVPAPRP